MENKNPESKDLVIPFSEAKKVTTEFMNPVVWTQMKGMAQTFMESHAIPATIKNVPQLMMILQAGLEMGMPPIEAMGSFYPVNGNLNLWGKAVVKRLRDHGYSIQYENEEPNVKTTAVVSKGSQEYRQEYTFDMAQKSGYTMYGGKLKVGWVEGVNRILKLRYGALNMIIKSYIPDVLGSVNGIAEVEEDAVIEEPTLPDASHRPSKPIASAKRADLKSFLESQKQKKAPAKLAKEKTVEEAEVVSEKAEDKPIELPPAAPAPLFTKEPGKDADTNEGEKLEAQRLRRAIVDLAKKDFSVGANDVVAAVKKKYNADMFESVTLAQLKEYYEAMQKGEMK